MELSWTFQLQRIFGVFPTDGTSIGYKHKLKSLVILCLQMCAFVSSCLFVYFPGLFDEGNYSSLFSICSMWEMASLLLIVISHVLSVSQHLKYFRRLFQSGAPKIVDFSEKIMLLCFLSTCAAEESIYTSEENDFWSWLDQFLYQSVAIIVTLIQTQFVAVVSELGRKFDAVLPTNKFNSVAMLEHSGLIAFVPYISIVYGPQNFVTVVITMLSTLRLAYQSTGFFMKGNNKMGYLYGIQLSFKFAQVLVLMRACERTKWKAEAFYDELFKLMRENKHLCKDNKLLLYVTVRQSVNFTACGFFNLGYPLVTSIITAVTTYLIILIQFSMPPSTT